MNLFNRTWIALLTSLLAIVLVYLSMPNYPLQPQGVVLPSTKVLPPYTGPVAIFTPEMQPSNATPVGTITVELHDLKGSLQSQQRLIAKAKQLAAAAGGNGLVVSLAHTVPSTLSIESMSLLQGSVIHYQPEDAL